MAITPVWCCGAECGVDDDAAVGHLNLFPNASFDTTTVRNGLRSLKCAATLATAYGRSTTFSAANIWVIRFYVRFATLPTLAADICTVGFSGAGGVYFNATDSSLYAGSSTIALGATGVSVTTGIWYAVDCKVNSSANPWTVDVQVDGTAAGQHTNAAGAQTSVLVQFGVQTVSPTFEIYFDDMMISNTAADYPLGAGKVLGHPPNRDGTHVATPAGLFARGVAGGANIISTGTPTTDSYLLIDDVPISSGAASDFITQVTSAAGSYVEHGYASMATGTAGPLALDVLIRHHKVTSAEGGFRWKLNDNGTTLLLLNYLSSAAGSSGPTYSRNMVTSMVGGGSWTLARFNGLLTRWGYSTDANPDVSLDAVIIEAAWDASGGATTVAVTATGIYGVGTLAGSFVHHVPVSALALSGWHGSRQWLA